MEIIIFFGICVLISSLFPTLAKGLTALITFGFLVPFFIIAVGSVSWGIGSLMGYHLSWLMSCLLFGVPFAGFTVWCIYGID